MHDFIRPQLCQPTRWLNCHWWWPTTGGGQATAGGRSLAVADRWRWPAAQLVARLATGGGQSLGVAKPLEVGHCVSIALAVVAETMRTTKQRDARNDMQKHIVKYMTCNSIGLAVVSETMCTTTQRDARNDMQKHSVKCRNCVSIALAVVSETLCTTTQRGARNGMLKHGVKCMISSGPSFVSPQQTRGKKKTLVAKR